MHNNSKTKAFYERLQMLNVFQVEHSLWGVSRVLWIIPHKQQSLKMGVYEGSITLDIFQIEIWLCGVNPQVHHAYWVH